MPIRALTRLRFVRFVASGAPSLAVGFATAVALRELAGLPPEIAGAAGLVASLLLSFVIVRRFVFARTGPPGGEFVRYVAISLGFRAIEYLAYLLLLDRLGLAYPAAYLVVVSCSVVAKFLLYRGFVFRTLPEAATAADA